MRLYAKIYVFAYVLLLVTVFVLPLFSFEGYSIVQNTINELGAQKVPGSWVANASIMFLSLAIVPLATKQLKVYWKQLAILYFFCISFFFTGVYQLAGFNFHDHIFNYTDDALHSLFSMITGFAFSAFCFFFIFIVEKTRERWQTFGAFSLALITPLLMWKHPEYKGIYQRILFLGSFGWLFYALTTYTFISAKSNLSSLKHSKKSNEHLFKNEK